MADTTATFAVNLEGNLEESALSKASALEQLQQKLEADTQALRGMQTALSRLKGGAGTSTETLRKLKEQISGQKAAIAQTQERYMALGGSFTKLKPAAKDASVSLAALVSAVQAGGGPAGSLAARLLSLGKVGFIAAGVTALVVAITALTAATLAAVAATAKYALAQADARRSEALRLEGMSKLRNFYLESFGLVRKADSGAFLQKTIDSVTSKTPLAREQVMGLTEEFYRAGMRAGNLQAAVEGASIALSAQGEAGLAQFKALAHGAAMWGKSVRAVANDYKARLGNIVARQMLSLDVQQRKFRENMQALFRGLNLEKLLEAVKLVGDFFSQAGAGGQALKAIVDGLFQPVIDFFAKHGLVAKRFFQGLILAALDFAIAVQTIRLELIKAFGPDMFGSLKDGAEIVRAGELAFWGLAFAVATTAIALGALIAAFGLILAAVGIALGAVFALGYGFAWLLDMIYQMIGGFYELGVYIVKGIADGILAGIKYVQDAITKVGNVIDKVFSIKMNIRSPSKLMAEKGRFVSKGAEVGIREGIPGVESATGDLAGAAGAESFTPTKQGAIGGGGGSTVVNVSFGNLQMPDSANANPKEFAAMLKEELVSLLRSASITMTAENA